MDSGMKDNSPEGIRERVESKRDEFAGGPDSGFETLEAAVDDTRHEAAQAWSGDSGAQSSGSVSPSGGVATESATTAQTTAGGGSAAAGLERETRQTSSTDTSTPPFNEEHPIGIGQQCFTCGAYNDLEAESCWNCSKDLTHSQIETPGLVESVMNPNPEEDSGNPPASASDTGGVAAPVIPPK